MHITLETDYAVRIVDILAKNKLISAIHKDVKNNTRIDAATISEKADVPLRFALKILRKLVSGGLVKSFKGIYGGYELMKEPCDISLYDIVEIVEGTYMFSRCLSSEYDCSCNTEGLPCTYQKVFSNITEIVCQELSKQTFDKLIKGE